MSIELWAGFVVAAGVVLLVPGPTILLVTGTVLAHGAASARRTVPGVILGDFVAMTVSLAGLGALLSASATLFAVLKGLGAAYLIYLGLRMWRRPVLLAAAGASAGDPRAPKLFYRGFVVTALNPKTITFFVAFLPQFLTPGAPVLPQMVLMVATFLALAAIVNLGYALLAGRARMRIADGGWLTLAQRAGGTLLIGAGVLTLAARRA